MTQEELDAVPLEDVDEAPDDEDEIIYVKNDVVEEPPPPDGWKGDDA